MNYSRKAIVLLQNVENYPIIEKSLSSIQIQIERSFSFLSSMDNACEKYKETGNTSFIRNDLMNLIKKDGVPYALFLDFRVKLSQNDEDDDMRLFKTFLVSFIVLSMSEEFSNIKGNFFVIYKKSDSLLDKLKLLPVNILDHLHTQNEKVNTTIENMKKNVTAFNRIFSINYYDEALLPQMIGKHIISFNTAFQLKLQMDEKNRQKGLSAISNANHSAARVIFRIDDNKMLVDGMLYENIKNEDRQIPLRTIFIEGAWTSRTLKEVNEKIIKNINKGIRELFIQKDHELIIRVDDSALIDGSTAAFLAQILVGQLSQFKKIKLLVSSKNIEIMRASTGYNMIKEFVKTID